MEDYNMDVIKLEDRSVENGNTKIIMHEFENIDAAKLFVYQFCFAWRKNVETNAAKSFSETDWKFENKEWKKTCNIVEKNNSHSTHIFTIKSCNYYF